MDMEKRERDRKWLHVRSLKQQTSSSNLYTENRIFKESPKYFRNIKNYREMNN